MKTEAQWTEELTRALDRPVRVSYGKARRNVIVARPDNPEGSWQRSVHLRLNHLFAEAPAEIGEDLAAWLRSGRRARSACRRLDDWIAVVERRLSELPRAPARIRTRGAHHDLAELSRDVLRQEFDESSLPDGVPEITWGPRSGRRARHTLQLGSFDEARALIRVHPVLDQEAVPAFFVKYILFHELLHAVQLAGRGGRRRHHDRAFRKRERQYPDYEAARKWQEEHIGELIRSARDAQPIRPEQRGDGANPDRWRQILMFPP